MRQQTSDGWDIVPGMRVWANGRPAITGTLGATEPLSRTPGIPVAYYDDNSRDLVAASLLVYAGDADFSDWYVTPSGGKCPWCTGDDNFEPGCAADELCRGHLAEHEGTSLAGLDRADAAERADMAALGFFDR